MKNNKWLSRLTMVLLILGLGIQAHCKGQNEQAKKEVKWLVLSEAIANHGPGYLEVVEKFEKKYPDIDVTLMDVPFGQLDDQTLTMGVAKGLPDLFLINDVPTRAFIEAGFLANLDPFLEETYGKRDPKEIYVGVCEVGYYEGSYYTLPSEADCRLLFYNKDLFKQAGLDPSKPPIWWEEYLDYNKKLTVDDRYGTTIHAGNEYGTMWEMGSLFLTTDGRPLNREGTRSTCNSSDMVNWIEFIMDLIPYSAPGYLSMGPEETKILFTQNKIAIALTGVWEIGGDFEAVDYGLGLIPKLKHDGSAGSGWWYGISAFSDNKEEAWLLYKFITDTVEINSLFNYGLPPKLAQYETEKFKLPKWAVVAEQMKSATIPIPMISQLNEVIKAFHDKVASVYLGTRTPEEALREADQEINKILEQ